VSDPDETVTFARFAGPAEPGRSWADDEAADTSVAAGVPGLVSLSYLTAAIRRKVWLWSSLALIGLLLGAAVYVEIPPPYKATTTLLITYSNNVNNGDGAPDAIATDVSLFESQAVAALTLHKLGLNESTSAFLGRYTITVVTNQIVSITLSAPSSSQAVAWSNVLAQECLSFRNALLTTQDKLVFSSLSSQLAAARGHLSSVNGQITQLSAERTSPDLKAQISKLKAERTTLTTNLGALEQNIQSTETTEQVATAATIKGASVLNPATPNHRSHFKVVGEYVGTGLALGLAIGLGIVIVQALLSSRLRRRYDIAQALGTAVPLSIGRVRVGGASAGGHRQAGSRSRGIRLVVRHLRDVRARIPQPAALALVPVDDADVAAMSLVTLAQSYAQRGLSVVLADLSAGARAARLLRVSAPGLHKVQADGAELSVFVADPRDVAPTGPLAAREPSDHEQASADLVAAYDAADRLLTLASLDPALGAEHLATWASAAVVIVTAGRSTGTKIRAAADMVRLSGTQLASAILIGADKNDESLGTAELPTAVTDRQPGLVDLGTV
jgi:capsular polysaccharide biosynthesis protein